MCIFCAFFVSHVGATTQIRVQKMVLLVFRLLQFEQKGNAFIIFKVKRALSSCCISLFLRLKNLSLLRLRFWEPAFIFSHIKIDVLKHDPFFHCADIYVTKICSSYTRVYISVGISDNCREYQWWLQCCICKYCV